MTPSRCQLLLPVLLAVLPLILGEAHLAVRAVLPVMSTNPDWSKDIRRVPPRTFSTAERVAHSPNAEVESMDTEAGSHSKRANDDPLPIADEVSPAGQQETVVVHGNLKGVTHQPSATRRRTTPAERLRLAEAPQYSPQKTERAMLSRDSGTAPMTEALHAEAQDQPAGGNPAQAQAPASGYQPAIGVDMFPTDGAYAQQYPSAYQAPQPLASPATDAVNQQPQQYQAPQYPSMYQTAQPAQPPLPSQQQTAPSTYPQAYQASLLASQQQAAPPAAYQAFQYPPGYQAPQQQPPAPVPVPVPVPVTDYQAPQALYPLAQSQPQPQYQYQYPQYQQAQQEQPTTTYGPPSMFNWFPVASTGEGRAARCKRQGAVCPGGGAGQQQQLLYCFSADTRVRRSDGRRVRMDELKVDDWILSADDGDHRIGYGRVESWAHRMPELMADFVQLRLADGKRLKLTEKHLIYKTAVCGEDAHREMVYADEVREGDCLYVVNDEAVVGNKTTTLVYQMRVEEVTMVRERGIYSPLTSTGDIVVEGILATTYTLVPHSVVQDVVFKRIKHYDDSLQSIITGSAIKESGEVELPYGLASLTELLEGVLFPALELHAK